ncbi:MAG: 23S rRNA (guanosine(2251)-2'-O)-methyltransferase RlmB [Ignavibacterium sp.]|uniref:23S rRNA (guanosine(2251)-2'-O)-methyltransferase RlmB n=1 Tax=Ignavibacterium sp. TaxID=2651167 RepID=UPI0021DBC320|nr:23S rRNA (guanosine(2251)-2'-O)-methyltransferase RlmB [Ignavibacterium sp.]BDQ04346.1 MAG: 23S rRNA (guanosine(2251)-2'-O)-methyltransferase RlmB [Ignavibacterium sp.]GIV46231.1 MAG: 23S rRNA (guanosine(2251)-2'-O)-methyltransferase RlmB [Ignavibacterium sp.]
MNLIIGRKPVLEALNSDEEITQVYILYGQEGGIINAIRVAAKKKGVKVSQITLEKFRQIVKDKNAQGVVALKSSQKFYTLQEIIQIAKFKNSKALSLGEGLGEAPLLLILDSIQDTHNVGAILRTAECSGVDGIIITKHNSAPINETVAKTSAGASEIVKICQVNNLANAIDELKKEGFWIVGSYLGNSKPYTEIDYKMPVALIVGNEEKGIRKLTADKCDFLVHIPMKGKIQSLNVSVAAGILLFEILRQRIL